MIDSALHRSTTFCPLELKLLLDPKPGDHVAILYRLIWHVLLLAGNRVKKLFVRRACIFSASKAFDPLL